jgi:hypothetical protein
MRQLSFETNFRDSLSWEIGRPDVRNELVLALLGRGGVHGQTNFAL